MAVRIVDLGPVPPDFRLPVRVGDGLEEQTIYLALDHDGPAVQALWRKQETTPVSLFAFVNPDHRDEWREHPVLIYRRRAVRVVSGSIPVDMDAMRDELLLHVKKFVLNREHRIEALRAEVKALEQVGTIERHIRTPIPTGVRIAVWHRDGGKCVKCGAANNLHFDHIIPVAKGGASTVENIELLCAQCNMQKSDKIM